MLKIHTVGKFEVDSWLGQMPAGPSRGLLFGGDRYSCCDQYIICSAGDDLVGIASIAPEGEQNSGRPTIVGLWIKPSFRNQGWGHKILAAAINQCLQRKFNKIRIDALNPEMKKTIEKVSPKLSAHLDVQDFSSFPSIFD